MVRMTLTVDNSGLITSFGDGSDSCCRNYTFLLRNFIRSRIGEEPSTATSMVADSLETKHELEVESGIYVRNPNPDFVTRQPKWYNNPKTTSRDQLTAMICFNAITSYHGNNNSRNALVRFNKACLKRLSFAQNTLANGPDATGWKLPDLITPDLWSISLRTVRAAEPIVAVLDIFMFLSVVLKLWGPTNVDGSLKLRFPGPTDTDDDNINSILMTAQYTYDTPFSWLARKFYKWFRQLNVGNTYLGESSPIMGALVSYHTDMGSVELADMARPIVAKY